MLRNLFKKSPFYYQPKNWLIHRLMWDCLKSRALPYANGIFLDLGCGARPYQNLFLPRVTAYFGLDRSAQDGVPLDLFGDTQSLPIASASIDTILISEVLEHLPSPGDAISEIQRVLKPGGHVILTTPLFWPLHEQPRDYYRFTKFGLQFLFEKYGLQVLEIIELTGFLATFAQLACYFLWSGLGQGKPIRILMFPPVWLLQRIAFLLNRLDQTYEFNCTNVIIGRKSWESASTQTNQILPLKTPPPNPFSP